MGYLHYRGGRGGCGVALASAAAAVEKGEAALVADAVVGASRRLGRSEG
jgi:hypothetical protein